MLGPDVLLIAIAGANGILARVAYVSAVAATATQWTHAAMLYALAELAHRGGADAGVLALVTLDSTMDDADGIVIPVAMACAGWLLLSSGPVPGFVPGLTFAVAAIGATLTLFGAVGGPDLGPVTVITAWIWLLDTGIIGHRSDISTYTAQDHVKAVVDKVGVHSKQAFIAHLLGNPDPR